VHDGEVVWSANRRCTIIWGTSSSKCRYTNRCLGFANREQWPWTIFESSSDITSLHYYLFSGETWTLTSLRCWFGRGSAVSPLGVTYTGTHFWYLMLQIWFRGSAIPIRSFRIDQLILYRLIYNFWAPLVIDAFSLGFLVHIVLCFLSERNRSGINKSTIHLPSWSCLGREMIILYKFRFTCSFLKLVPFSRLTRSALILSTNLTVGLRSIKRLQLSAGTRGLHIHLWPTPIILFHFFFFFSTDEMFR